MIMKSVPVYEVSRDIGKRSKLWEWNFHSLELILKALGSYHIIVKLEIPLVILRIIYHHPR